MKFNKWSKVLGLAVATIAFSASANEHRETYFDIKEVRVKETFEPKLPLHIEKLLLEANKIPLPKKFSEGSGTGLSLATIINMGEKIWKIVDKGRPVVNVNLVSANALPKGIEGWDSLSEWQNPTSRLYQVKYMNGFGMEVVNFSYRVVSTTGGGYKGVGKYISQISVLPAEVDVAWGFTFNAETLVPNVLNVGSDAAPIAGAEVSVKWEVVTPLKHSKRTNSYFIRGDGQFVNLNK